MITVGVAQIKNSIEVADNFTSIKKCLDFFADSNVDLVLFPECSLSGFSIKMEECTEDVLQPYLDFVESWSIQKDKAVILPTALRKKRIFNAAYFFYRNEKKIFYKYGLTDSEKHFFSIPEDEILKIFSIKDYQLAVLMCAEAEQSPWGFIKPGEVDVILWPGYWGWGISDKWGDKKASGESNLVYKNMNEWRVPLIQSNFSSNDLKDYRDSGPHGRSVFVNSDNRLYGEGGFDKEACYSVLIEGNRIVDCTEIGVLN